MSNRFWKDLNKGREGEKLFYKVLKDKHDIIDVTGNSAYWKIDVDFIVDGKMVEVKSDWNSAYTGNVCLEKYKNGGKKGWFDYTEAEYLVFMDMVNKIMYKTETQKLRDYVEKHSTNLSLVKERWLGEFYCYLVNIKKYPDWEIMKVANL